MGMPVKGVTILAKNFEVFTILLLFFIKFAFFSVFLKQLDKFYVTSQSALEAIFLKEEI